MSCTCFSGQPLMPSPRRQHPQKLSHACKAHLAVAVGMEQARGCRKCKQGMQTPRIQAQMHPFPRTQITWPPFTKACKSPAFILLPSLAKSQAGNLVVLGGQTVRGCAVACAEHAGPHALNPRALAGICNTRGRCAVHQVSVHAVRGLHRDQEHCQAQGEPSHRLLSQASGNCAGVHVCLSGFMAQALHQAKMRKRRIKIDEQHFRRRGRFLLGHSLFKT